jgi:hypothetical protein
LFTCLLVYVFTYLLISLPTTAAALIAL